MNKVFRKAERSKSKLRLAIDGPSGCGKTLSSLLIAHGIVGDWSKIALIDTERGSGDLYTGHTLGKTTIGEYAVVTMPPPYEPANYIELICAAATEGFEIVIVDSLSHAWSGEGGVLDAPASYFCKHPPRQHTDDEAYLMTEGFIAGVKRKQRNEVPDPRSRQREPTLAEG